LPRIKTDSDLLNQEQAFFYHCKEFEMAKKNQHVVPTKDGQWAVVGAGNQKATRVTDTKQQAINVAT
jgi:hypothetical protein